MNIAFPVWAAVAALGESSETVEQICDDLERRTGLVRRAGHDDLPDGTRSDFYSFAHQFYREVLYERQTTSRRARGHIRIAEQLKWLFAGREAVVAREVARHFEAAGNWQRTVCTLRAGALYARERCAEQDSMQLLAEALRVAENLSEPERTAICSEIADELQAMRDGDKSQRQKAS